MISWHDLYTVLTAVVPLYVAMILAYGSVRWWRIFSPDQCAGINRFVAVFAVPLLSFHFISSNNPYAMNFRFIAADTLQKLIVLAGITLWARLAPTGNLDWAITVFSLATLPNTLVMGIPLLIAMYGPFSGSLMVQVVVLQCIIWYTLLLFLFEYRAARALIADQFPDTAASIVSFNVDSDIVSLDGGPDHLQAETEIGGDGKLHVTVRKSNASRRSMLMTPRPSNLTGAEIYSLSSSRNQTPRGSNFNHSDFFAMVGGAPPLRHSNFGPSDLYSVQSSRGPTPRPSNFEEHHHHGSVFSHYPAPNHDIAAGSSAVKKATLPAAAPNHDAKELHMFVWSSTASPATDAGGLQTFGGNDFAGGDAVDGAKEIRMLVPADMPPNGATKGVAGLESEDFRRGIDNFSFGGGRGIDDLEGGGEEMKESGGPEELTKLGSSSTVELHPKSSRPQQMPPTSVMTRLILIMVWRKLIRNPNTYSSLIGLIWSLVAFRWHVSMPKILEKSISILSDAGLTAEVPDDAPLGLTVYHKQIVLYRDGAGVLRCYEDRCPHRLAKLSEGQLVDGRLECLYHGWQFEGDGKCVKIPQLPDGAKIPRAACVRTYEVRDSQGVVWVWMSDKNPPDSGKLPWFEHYALPGFQDNSTIHELPYDHSILLENLMDPAHVPISHDRTDWTAKREDAQPLVMNVQERNSRGFAGEWRRSRGSKFVNSLRFQAPCVLSNSVEFIDKKGVKQYSSALFLCRPAGQGKSMLIVRFGSSLPLPGYRLLPKWYFHQNAGKVFEQDMGFLSSQNEVLVKEKLPTKQLYLNLKYSDTWVAEYRKWMDKVGHGMPYYFGHGTLSPPVEPAVVEQTPAGVAAGVSASFPAKGGIGAIHAPNPVSRYFRHVVHCKGCRSVVKAFEGWKKALMLLALLAAAAAVLATAQRWKVLFLASAALFSAGSYACYGVVSLITTNFIRIHRRL